MAQNDGDRVELDATLKHETAKGWKLAFDDDNEGQWFAKSMVNFDTDTGKAEMPEWMAKKEGLI